MTTGLAEADYIVGGGLTGCVIAARLKQAAPHWPPLAAFQAHYTDIDWAYQTVPQPGLNNRPLYLTAGKVFSGGSATNYGAPEHADPLVTIGVEHHHDPTADPSQHGFDGPMYTEQISTNPKRRFPLREPLKEAWEHRRFERVPDANNGRPLGLGEVKDNWRERKRQQESLAYDMTGVDALHATRVNRVLFNDHTDTGWNCWVEIPFTCERKISFLRAPFKRLTSISSQALDPPTSSPSTVSRRLSTRPITVLDLARKGSVPDETKALQHPLLPHVEYAVLYDGAGVPDPMGGSLVTLATIVMTPTSRGSITLASSVPNINPNHRPSVQYHGV
ncbi:hypothetical protein BZG36_00752 [Bifiguratus adelaidae]|uniref:Uncharacterized protein n=1 Tax=Bifiguratus adelaidae TaxID=1938954 RepID=A0A261Y7A7_9FUNG|nr:hypothetical protein BZG36_00752 [Bifiguratus adelaidae]